MLRQKMWSDGHRVTRDAVYGCAVYSSWVLRLVYRVVVAEKLPHRASSRLIMTPQYCRKNATKVVFFS